MSDIRTLTYIYHYAYKNDSGLSGDGIYKTLDMIQSTHELETLRDYITKKIGVRAYLEITSLSRIGEMHYV